MSRTPSLTPSQAPSQAHVPVLLDAVIDALRPIDGAVYVDGTFGVGGYTRALLEAADCLVYAIDRDPDAVARAQAMAGDYPGRLVAVAGRFGAMDRLVRDAGASRVQGIALDLGVSSPQLDQAGRGFSFRADGPLDMRMDQAGPSAADVVNEASERELADILFHLGEERLARRIARAIVAARTRGAIRRTGELADLVRRVVPAARSGGIDPATRTFQALRIHVNRELEELDHGLEAAERLLSPGGRLAVVSFHSLEDRRVKTFLRRRSGRVSGPSRHDPAALGVPVGGPADDRAPTFTVITGRPVGPSEDEIARNPRARSARLRVGERTGAPDWPIEEAA